MPRGSQEDRFHLLEGIGRDSFKQKQELEPGRTSEAEGRAWRGRALPGEGTAERAVGGGGVFLHPGAGAAAHVGVKEAAASNRARGHGEVKEDKA